MACSQHFIIKSSYIKHDLSCEIVIDAFYENPNTWEFNPLWLEDLNKLNIICTYTKIYVKNYILLYIGVHQSDVHLNHGKSTLLSVKNKKLS